MKATLGRFYYYDNGITNGQNILILYPEHDEAAFKAIRTLYDETEDLSLKEELHRFLYGEETEHLKELNDKGEAFQKDAPTSIYVFKPEERKAGTPEKVVVCFLMFEKDKAAHRAIEIFADYTAHTDLRDKIRDHHLDKKGWVIN